MDDTRHPTESPRAESSTTLRVEYGLTIDLLELLSKMVADNARAADALERLAGAVEGGVRSNLKKQNRRLSPEDKEYLAIAELLRQAPRVPSMEEIAELIGVSRSAVYLMEELKKKRKLAIAAAQSGRTIKGYVDRRRAGERAFDAWEEEDVE